MQCHVSPQDILENVKGVSDMLRCRAFLVLNVQAHANYPIYGINCGIARYVSKASRLPAVVAAKFELLLRESYPAA